MSHPQTCIWIKTSALLQSSLNSSSSSNVPLTTTSKRSSYTSSSSNSNSNNNKSEYRWALATILKQDSSSSSITVKIQDENCEEYNGKTIDISTKTEEEKKSSSDSEQDGIYVMANQWEQSSLQNASSSSTSNHNNIPPSDLIHLTHLHEPAVVYCLQKRYESDCIYTSTGPILLALNPFKDCRALYSEDQMDYYFRKGEEQLSSSSNSQKDEEQQPHVFASADGAFRAMMMALQENNQGADQCILVSGESGAGKTMTTKFIMKYLASLSERKLKMLRQESCDVGGDNEGMVVGSNVEEKVLKSNPILESFGNARTIRNDNSSRFGKFIELHFTNNGSFTGAAIETYLLEKVRLIIQAPGERNYHIFYELLAGVNEQQREDLFLNGCCCQDFKMTSQSGTFDRRDGVADGDVFPQLLMAMNKIGFSSKEQIDLITLTAAILHFSNLTFTALSADESEINRDESNAQTLNAILNLMGFSLEHLNNALCSFTIQCGKEIHRRSLPKQKAEVALEALIKATYGALFTYVVQRVNSCIVSEQQQELKVESKQTQKTSAYIGVLDIFGFESFETNSFEQLCINYCNETLQQQFNLFVFKNEQKDYEREGIQWSFIEFPDNQTILDLIEKKGSGILPILDDQCKAPGTTDKTFATDIYKKCTSHSHFQADYRQVGSNKFGVRHYAGIVEYDTIDFVAKNKDELPREATELLSGANNDFVRILADIIHSQQQQQQQQSAAMPANKGGISSRRGSASSNNKRTTVGGQFTRQLRNLRHRIDTTSPHYVRCLKPNHELIPDKFDRGMIADQLMCAGVLEAVRVSRVGYPQRYAHGSFVKRYRMLLGDDGGGGGRQGDVRGDCTALVHAIANQMIKEERGGECVKQSTNDLISLGIQIGNTKIFLQTQAFQTMERYRNQKLRLSTIRIQSEFRKRIAQTRFQISLTSVQRLQCHIRCMRAVSTLRSLRKDRAVIILQKHYRRSVACHSLCHKRYLSIWCQKVHRGNMGRFLYHECKRRITAVKIQTFWRMQFLQQEYQQKWKSVLVVQCWMRCHAARKVFQGLKMGAKDLSAVTIERDSLRKELMEAKREIEELKNRIADGGDATSVVPAAHTSSESNTIPIVTCVDVKASSTPPPTSSPQKHQINHSNYGNNINIKLDEEQQLSPTPPTPPTWRPRSTSEDRKKLFSTPSPTSVTNTGFFDSFSFSPTQRTTPSQTHEQVMINQYKQQTITLQTKLDTLTQTSKHEINRLKEGLDNAAVALSLIRVSAWEKANKYSKENDVLKQQLEEIQTKCQKEVEVANLALMESKTMANNTMERFKDAATLVISLRKDAEELWLELEELKASHNMMNPAMEEGEVCHQNDKLRKMAQSKRKEFWTKMMKIDNKIAVQFALTLVDKE